MLDIIDKFPYPQDGQLPEDLFFSGIIHASYLDKICTTETGEKLSMETQYNDKSIGAHAIYKYHDADKIRKFLKSINYPFKTL